MKIRPATPADEETVVELRAKLWPHTPLAEHRADTRATLAGRPMRPLPLVVFVAEADGGLVGFIEVGLRSYAEGCDPTRPCCHVEGWYVEPSRARQGVGRLLMERAEAWCREQGLTEIASDTPIDNGPSQRAHEALGFQVADRCVHYRKSLVPED